VDTVPAASASATFEAACEYLDRGWAILPLAPEDKVPHHCVLREVYGKSAWAPLGRRPASRPELEAWLDVDPRCGIGVLTGSASGGLVVADVDGDLDVRHPPTAAVATGRGWHFYFTTDLQPRSAKTSWGDLKVDGGYVVAPPSIHPNGKRYEWAVGLDETLAKLEESALWTPEGRPQGKGQKPPRHRYLCLRGAPEAPVQPQQLCLGGTADAPRTSTEPFASDEASVLAALPVLGINAPLGKTFRCVLPGHSDNRPSASLCKDRDGIYRYRDWHRQGPFEWLTLAELRAAQISGQVARLKPPVAARWYDRLFAEAGLIQLPSIAVPPFQKRVAKSAEKVREGFELLLRIRERHEPGEPIPFTRSFATCWCGVSEDQARDAIMLMRTQGVIIRVGEHRIGGRSMYLYRPDVSASS